MLAKPSTYPYLKKMIMASANSVNPNLYEMFTLAWLEGSMAVKSILVRSCLLKRSIQGLKN